MSDGDPKTTPRELREYFASSYEALGKLATQRLASTTLLLPHLLTYDYESFGSEKADKSRHVRNV
jgi:hypothetical protein